MKEFIKELIFRIKSESPKFFKVIGNFGIALIAFSTILLGADQLDLLPEIYKTIGSHALGIGLTMKGISALTKKDKEKEDV
jgi:hypothetical protein